MKFCSQCGSELQDGIRFCASCGTPVPTEETTPAAQEVAPEVAPIETAEPEQQATPSVEVQAAPQPQAAPVFTQPILPPAIKALKSLGTSPLFLVGVIAFTVNLFMSLITSVSGTSGIMGIIYRIASELDMEYAVYNALDGMHRFATVSSAIGTIIGMIPSIILAIGLWMIFAACASKTAGKLGTGGLTTIKVMTMNNLIFVCIGLVISELALLVALIAALNSFAGEEGAIAIGIIMLVVLLCMVLSIVYYAKVLKSINAAKNTAITGRPYAQTSRFVGVLCYIGAVCSIIGIIPSIGTVLTGYMGIGGFFASLMTTICSVATSICFGVLIFKYRSQMTGIQMQTAMYAPQQPVYGANQNWQ